MTLETPPNEAEFAVDTILALFYFFLL
ncbi:uncharacterized protein METZ01_LOCUS13611 [marine metagenome]|uniref:Uncharacterized protein n=1 Tax=marine metagenome TaxID=408172 RepID=A0A381P2R5_9ZZZZ